MCPCQQLSTWTAWTAWLTKRLHFPNVSLELYGCLVSLRRPAIGQFKSYPCPQDGTQVLP